MKYWAILFEDAACGPEVFTDEAIARKVFDARRLTWNCTLMAEAESARAKYGATIGEPQGPCRCVMEDGIAYFDACPQHRTE